MSLFSRLSVPVYKNTGSVARDHLASERTFLAWMRTGLGLIALGIATERFNQLDVSGLLRPADGNRDISNHHKDTGHTFTAALLGTGSGSIVYGIARYFSTMRYLEKGLYKPAYFGAGALGAAVAGIAGTTYWYSLKTHEDVGRESDAK